MAEYIEREATCGDCIHADRCEKNPLLTEFSRENVAYCGDFLDAADVAPVVHGEWEHLESGWHDLWRCTSCGDEWTFEYDPTDKETMVNFCPNCGADMRERKGDDGSN